MPAASLQSVPVLMYHEISEPGSATWDHLAVSPATFREQLAYLRDAGYTTLTAGALATLIAEGRPIPSRSVVLTFDDGFADFALQAVPALIEYECAATVFVTTDWVEGGQRDQTVQRPGRMLSWSQIKETVAAGFEVGAHSCAHPQLDQIPLHRLRDELHRSKTRLEDFLSIPVQGLAYPYGYSNAMVRESAQEMNYTYGYAVRNVAASSGGDLFRLARLTVHRSTTLGELRRLVEGKLALTMVRDRAMTTAWSPVRRSRAVLAAARGQRYALHQ